ncbi:hypothetical protein EDD18DRAFT_1106929 [Armillaria luteobubalina]|uniref:Uncharacterized protein n=1 Tax=Armillaria luteobubalina TaxID=153913 RepID=A0AA39Q2M7_9AGAR|nr:hypothetical protein EDD18DRAFT_1106929 [Armillaria luteobubalina]
MDEPRTGFRVTLERRRVHGVTEHAIFLECGGDQNYVSRVAWWDLWVICFEDFFSATAIDRNRDHKLLVKRVEKDVFHPDQLIQACTVYGMELTLSVLWVGRRLLTGYKGAAEISDLFDNVLASAPNQDFSMCTDSFLSGQITIPDSMTCNPSLQVIPPRYCLDLWFIPYLCLGNPIPVTEIQIIAGLLHWGLFGTLSVQLCASSFFMIV